MQNKEANYFKKKYPRLSAFSKAAAALSIDEIIEIINRDEKFAEECKKLYIVYVGLPDEEVNLREACRKKMGSIFGELCIRSLDLTRYIYLDDSNNDKKKYIRWMVDTCSSLIKTKIFRFYGALNRQERKQWIETVWNEWRSSILHERITDKLKLMDKGDNLEGDERAKSRHENILTLIDVDAPNNAGRLIYYVCGNDYIPRPGGYISKRQQDLYDPFTKFDLVSLDSLVFAAKKCPYMAYKIINTMSKESENIPYIKELLPYLKISAEKGDKRSLDIVLVLRMLGLYSEESEDINDIFEEWEKGIKSGDEHEVKSHNYFHMLFLKGFTDLLAGKNLPEEISGFSLKSAQKADLSIQEDPIAAQRFYKFLIAMLEKMNEKLKQENDLLMSVRAALIDPEFVFKLAEAYQRRGQFGKAIAMYQQAFTDGNNFPIVLRAQLDKLPEETSRMSNTVWKLGEKIRSLEKYVQINGPEAKFRIAMLWADRFYYLNKNPENDPELCLLMAQKLMCKGKFSQAHRLLEVIPPESDYFQDAENVLKLVAQFKKEFDDLVAFVPRIDVVEYILPFYANAKESGHEEATRMLIELEEEHKNLKENKSAGYTPKFVEGIGGIGAAGVSDSAGPEKIEKVL